MKSFFTQAAETLSTVTFALILIHICISTCFLCLHLTGKETQAVNRPGRLSGNGLDTDVLARLSLQSQQAQAELHHSLQHMRQQRAQLQTSLRQERETSYATKELDQNGVCCALFTNAHSNIKPMVWSKR